MTATQLKVSEGSSTIANPGTDVFTATVSAPAATGTVQFFADGVMLGAPVAVAGGAAVSSAVPFTSAGRYLITAMYSGDSGFMASTAPGIALTVTGLTPGVTVTASSTAVPVGTSDRLWVTVAPVSGAAVPTGIVRFYLSGAAGSGYVATVPLVGGMASTQGMSFSVIGSYSISAAYLGDAVYSPRNSAGVPFAVQKLPTTTQLTATAGDVGLGGYKQFSILIGTPASATSVAGPTGTAQFFANGVALGGPVPLVNGFANLISSPIDMFATAGAEAVTAMYSGDGNWQPSTSSAVNFNVLSTPPTYRQASNPSALTLAAGAITSNTGVVTVAGQLGFQGPVSLTCAVTYSGTATVPTPPTCSLANGTTTISVGTSSQQVGFTIGTTVRSSAQVGSPVADGRRGGLLGIAGGVAFSALCLTFRPGWRRGRRSLLAMFICLVALSGCSNGSSSTPPPSNPTPTPSGTTAGSYTVTITASTTVTGVAVPAPAVIALTVN